MTELNFSLGVLYYATCHSIYTYAFYFPRTKRVLYRQDCIFLVYTFPMRMAREASGLPPSGEPLVTVRSSFGFRDDMDNDLSFHGWANGDDLLDFDDHVAGVPLTAPLHLSRETTPDLPPSWPRRFPYHVSFGAQSAVSVPTPAPFPREITGTRTSNKQASATSEIELLDYSEVASSSTQSNKQASAMSEIDLLDYVPDPPPAPGVSGMGRTEPFSVPGVAPLGRNVEEDVPRSPSPPAPYSLHDWDVDSTRGMGHLLREPRLSVSVPPITKHRAPAAAP